MMSAGSISVIVPVKDGERFLADALKSILGQTRRPDEIIVIDDGSQDRSAEIASGFAEIRCISQENAGQAKARNRGVEESRGELIAFLDADDVWLPDKIAFQVAHFEENPELDAVFGAAELFAEDTAPESVRAALATLPATMPAQLPSAALIRRRAHESVGGFDPQLELGETVDWYARLLAAGIRMITPDHIVYRRRIHDANIGLTKRDRRDEYLSIVRAAIQRKRSNKEGS